jgi:NAD(P)-dependent dehydrogenase (short-subunit alcohol dehydrogenase family)
MLENKKFIVIGASGLLGSKVVESILSNHGEVIAIDNDVKKLKDLYKNKISIIKMNINNNVSLQKIIMNSKDISGLVNCAYLKNKNFGKKFEDVKVESFNENVSLNLGTTFNINKICVEWFNKYKREFSLINIGSIYGSITPKFTIYKSTSINPPIEYTAIKSAIIGMTKYISAYVKNSKFRCNCVSPGGIYDNQPRKFVSKYKEHTNGIGMLDALKISETIIFLLSNKSDYITGQNIIVDDGFTI